MLSPYRAGSARLGRKGRPDAPVTAGAGLRQGPGVRSRRAAAPADRTPDAAPSPPPSPGSGSSRSAGSPQPRASRSSRARRSGEAFRLVPPLPAARASRRFAKARGLLPQPVARRQLRTRRTVQTQPAPEFRILSPQRFQLPLKRRNQDRDLRRQNHPPTESRVPPTTPQQRRKKQKGLSQIRSGSRIRECG
jgi:hypothetical protein